MDYTVHGILQARILQWVATPFSRGSSQPRSSVLWADSSLAEPQEKPKNTGVGSLSLLQQIFPTQESCIAGGFFTNWAIREALFKYSWFYRLPKWLSSKESSCQYKRHEIWFDPWVRKIPWNRKRQSTPVFLPGESHGQRSLASYSP